VQVTSQSPSNLLTGSLLTTSGLGAFKLLLGTLLLRLWTTLNRPYMWLLLSLIISIILVF